MTTLDRLYNSTVVMTGAVESIATLDPNISGASGNWELRNIGASNINNVLLGNGTHMNIIVQLGEAYSFQEWDADDIYVQGTAGETLQVVRSEP